ncbi:filamentous hemagglutinin N-terminal domain-containing protein [Rhizobacter sp. J219]|uniref:beta strand repeat-containing protein n=1 Tax=Rhizobacter sp. J219 TaxID=2898430 RepID=UPI002151D530|nr:filamentous hemagglutinin N-terminal domain-containing protein [Rhizobacter sp. J219]MCR5882454.1 filamentous hemagglutinin N-terminal domain-containing protein [Rhizobacter sp. J219]
MRAFQQSPIAIAALLTLGAAHAQPVPTALPVLRPNGAVVNATVGTPANNTLTINQTASTSNRALIEWSSFSIGRQAAVNITQPNTQSVLVNRVMGSGNGPSASEIYGSMTANGRVFLLNPAGVVFGPGAQVNVGSLVATSLDLDPSMSDANYARLMRGDDLALTATAGSDVQVMAADDPRRPQIRVTEGGSIVLMGTANVVQDGVISAPGGLVNLTTAGDAIVRPVGSSGFVQLAVTGTAEARTTGISLGGGSQTLASGGSIVIGGQPRDETRRGDLISIAGTASTDSATGAAGNIHIDAGASGDVLATEGAVVTASSTAAAGGSITVLGADIRLQRGDVAHPRLLADGRSGGGSIDVGNSQTRAITLDTGTLVSADATGSGDGGQIRLRAMYNNPNATSPVARLDFGVTEAYGTLRARGGTEGGNGGAIETSGMAVTTALQDGTLARSATIDARARAAGGRAGSWTLDPYDVTISSSAPVAVNGSFNPTGPGANVQASDLSAALNAGTSIDISTEAGGAGTQAGNITIAPGTVITRSTGTTPASFTLRANGNILVDTATLDASGAGPVSINLYSDLDGNGTGSVLISNSTLRTGGGNLTVSGGIDPTTGYARGDTSTAGIGIVGSTIDTVGTTRGDVLLRGRAAAFPGAAAGVNLASTFTLGNLTVDGRASHGTGVNLNGASIGTASGLIDIRGIATRVDTATAGLIGIDTGTASVQLGTGSMTLAGRGDDANITSASAVGLRMGDLLVSASTASTGTVTIAGQSTGGSIGPGIQNQISGNSGLVIRSNAAVPTSAPTGANVVIGALADIRASSLELGVIGLGPTIATTGGVNIRPLGVSATGALVEQPTVPITLRPIGSNFGAATFVVSAPLLQAASISAGLGTVIGSQGHTGAIVVDTNTFTSHAGVAVTLQNEGTGSAGITLGSGNTLGNLALLTTGNVSQAASGVSVNNLVVRGGAASTVNLNSATNQIAGNLAFDPPAALTVRTGGGLTVGAATAQTFDAASSSFAPLAITTSLGGTTALLQAGGAVAVNQPIQMTGSGATQLDIVSPTSVTFAAGATLTSASSSGRWNVWAPTVVNAPGAGSATNLYGCVFGDTATCSVSGIARPTSGNQLLHPTQPTLTVTADPLTGFADLALPPLTFSVSGLVNGDTAGQALSGLLATTPTGTLGQYSIGAGTLASPTGYTLAFTGSTLTLRPGITRHMLQSAFHTEMASDVYGSNLDQPYICTAASVVRGGLVTGGQSDPLASEWGKVRNQPQLSGCLNVTDGGSCSAF